MRILITGAAGFIGSNLADHWIRDHEVTGVDNFDPFYPRALKERNVARWKTTPGSRFVEMDLLDHRALDSLMAQGAFELVVHLAAKAGVRPSIDDPLSYVRGNVDATALVLQMAKEHGVPSVIFASSSSVYGNNSKVPFCESDNVDYPISPYAATKKSCELLCHSFAHLHGIKIAVLRFFTVYGRRQRPDLAIAKFSDLIQKGLPIPVYGDGSTERDYTFIDDIVQGIDSCLSWLPQQADGAFEIFNLGESRTVSLANLVEALERAHGKKALIDRRPFQPGDVKRTFADISKAKSVLGYRPRVPIEEGLKEYVRWLKHPD